MKNTYFVENCQQIKVKQASYYKGNHKLITCGRNSKKAEDSISRIKLFTKLCKTGPVFVCVICNRSPYKKSVKKADQAKYNFDLEGLICEISRNDHCICLTCHGYLKKQKISVQAVCNKLNIFAVPEILLNLNRLERVLISRRTLFKKINVMQKWRFPKLKRSICNIPIDSNDIANVLSQGADSNGILVVNEKGS